MARLLCALLVALALFCAPVAMHMGGTAMATPVAARMDSGCERMGHHSTDKQKPSAATSCAVACAAIPGLSASIPAEMLHDKAEPFVGPVRQLAGIGLKAELPPPRNSDDLNCTTTTRLFGV